MIFDTIATDQATGAILAHAVPVGSGVFRKGRRLTAADVASLADAGVQEVVAARLERGDVHEDEAAERIARVLLGPGLSASAAFTGRVNLFAVEAGLFKLDRERIGRLNRIDESVTIATLPDHAEVRPRQMVATIKIIPFAAPVNAVLLVETMAHLPEHGPALRVAPYRPLKVALIQTMLPGTRPRVLDKTVAVTADRVSAFGGSLVAERRSNHHAGALAGEIRKFKGGEADLLLLIGASAITDRRDVLPAAIEAAGGTVEHFGMPVDPGNLLLLARIGAVPVLGLPGCARSPKLNGFDWVLRRLAAGLRVTRLDIMAMGVGGLLTEIPSRPAPREGTIEAPRAPVVATVVLAAGRSTRMGGPNKLLQPVDGKPMVAHAVDAALASNAASVVVVTGHQAEQVEEALAGRIIRVVRNPSFADGLSGSLAVGLDALPENTDAVLVCLGDMPRITARHLDRLIAAYDPEDDRAIVVPTFDGKRGNPVLWDRRFFAAMRDVAGDVGARHLIGENADLVAEVAMDEAVLFDVDTPERLAALAAGIPA
jgi:molybdenum cofactor cytidylyltransferase